MENENFLIMLATDIDTTWMFSFAVVAHLPEAQRPVARVSSIAPSQKVATMMKGRKEISWMVS